MDDDESYPFRQTVCSFMGMTDDEHSSLLSSLPNELIFNDLRDASRRGYKAETCTPCNLHACALKSCSKRPAGCSGLDISQEDWCNTLKGKSVRATVHSATKPRDVQLGIDCNGLTRHRKNNAYTKPHVFCQRLRLLRVLQQVWENAAGDNDMKGEAVLRAYKSTWTSKLIPTQTFLRWDGPEQMESRNMVLSSGPHAVQYAVLNLIPGCAIPTFGFVAGYQVPRDPQLVGPVESFELCMTKPVLTPDGQLGWQEVGSFMKVWDYVADHTITEISHDLLSRLCSSLKIRNHSKLGHKRRVDAFLQHLGRDPAFIEEVLDEIPEHQPRPRQQVEQDRDEWD